MLTLKNVTKKYGKTIALDNVSFSFDRGIYSLLGPNGSGKSTLMSLACGLFAPTDGEILFDGENIKKLKGSYLCRIGYMPQYPGMYPSFSVFDFMCYLSSIKGLAKNNEKEIKYLLKRVELYDVMQNKIATLSGGMRQRLALAGAVLGDPEIIILDEPTAGLDIAQRISVRSFLDEISKSKTVIWATHIASDVEQIAEKNVFLKNGRIVDVMSQKELLESGLVLEQKYMTVFGDVL